MRDLTVRRIGGAALLAAALHAGALIAAFWPQQKNGAVATGDGGLAMSLAAASGAASAAAEAREVEAEETSPETPPEEVQEQEVLEETPVEEAPVENVEATPTETIEEIAPEQPVEDLTPTEVAAAAPETAEPIEAAEIETAEPTPVETAAMEPETVRAEAPKPKARPKPPKPPVAKKPVEKPIEKPAARPVRRSPPKPVKRPAPEQRTATSDRAERAAEDHNSVSGANAAGTVGRQASGGGDPGAIRDFRSRIKALVARHKRYPRRAEARGVEGVGRLVFTLEADGRVSGARLAGSSGQAELDAAILDMIARAQPLPAIPPELGVTRMSFEFSVRFERR